MFQNCADLLSDLVCGRFTEPCELACRRIDYTHQHSEGSGLSASIRTKHVENLTFLHVEVEVVNGVYPAEMFREVRDG